MKSEKLPTATGVNSGESAIEAAVRGRRKLRRLLYNGIIAAACICILTAGAIILSSINNAGSDSEQLSDSGTDASDGEISGSDRRWPAKVISSTDGVPSESAAYVPKWDELSISQQYSSLVYGGSEYGGTVKSLDPAMAEEPSEAAELTGYDEYTGTKHVKNGTVLHIKGISPLCAVAVRFDGDSSLYVYRSSLYRPETLGQLIDDLSLRENLTFNSVWYSYWRTAEKKNGDYTTVEFTGLKSDDVWALLLDDTSLENVTDYDSRSFETAMSVSIDIELLGYSNISLSVTADGWLTTNILDTGKAFFVGEERVQRFMEHVFERCDGHEIIYADVVTPESGGEAGGSSSSTASHSVSTASTE